MVDFTEGFIFAEDYAIKQKLLGITVHDETAPTNGRPVAVRYRLPESEVADVQYPQIIINPPEIRKASEREHRGSTYLTYAPADYVGDTITGIDRDNHTMVPDWDPATSPVDQSPFFVSEYPIPFDFDYQITVETRKQSHLTQLMFILAQMDYLPARFGYLEVPTDGTIRSLFLIGGPEILPTKDMDSKRLFRAVYRIRVASEMSMYKYKQILSGDLVQHIHVTTEVIP